MTRTISFTATVNPCKVIELSGEANPAELSIVIGDQAVNSFAMTFTQTAACGYTENVLITSPLPEFITFNEGTNDFTIEASDISHEASYTLMARASVEVPTDYTFSQKDVLSTDVTI